MIGSTNHFFTNLSLWSVDGKRLAFVSFKSCVFWSKKGTRL
ncbi:hypothetical protein H6228_002556 [Enterococcus faecalis]|nr:hypothetical protein [Enterococcus faecalis]EGO5077014.1 hypothetical protein [Enterococcus faecalis]